MKIGVVTSIKAISFRSLYFLRNIQPLLNVNSIIEALSDALFNVIRFENNVTSFNNILISRHTKIILSFKVMVGPYKCTTNFL